jgi:hypothetical protein
MSDVDIQRLKHVATGNNGASGIEITSYELLIFTLNIVFGPLLRMYCEKRVDSNR